MALLLINLAVFAGAFLGGMTTAWVLSQRRWENDYYLLLKQHQHLIDSTKSQQEGTSHHDNS